MSDSGSLADLAARLREVAATPQATQPSPVTTAPVRFVVATDFSDAAVPLTVLRAYQAAFAPSAPVDLCFAVPREPGPQDVDCVHVLLEGLGEGAAVAAVSVESFAEVGGSPYDSALVPSGDLAMLIAEVGGFITRMFDASRQMQGGAVADANQGSLDALNRRLGAFSV